MREMRSPGSEHLQQRAGRDGLRGAVRVNRIDKVAPMHDRPLARLASTTRAH